MQQKETLSAFMDGETVNVKLANQIANDTKLKQSWENFHLIRSVMRMKVMNY